MPTAHGSGRVVRLAGRAGGGPWLVLKTNKKARTGRANRWFVSVRSSRNGERSALKQAYRYARPNPSQLKTQPVRQLRFRSIGRLYTCYRFRQTFRLTSNAPQLLDHAASVKPRYFRLVQKVLAVSDRNDCAIVNITFNFTTI